MPLIEIPDEYWTITPRGFAALVAEAQPAITSLFSDLGDGASNLQVDNDANVAPQLGDLDGDAFVLSDNAAGAFAAANAAPSADVVKQIPSGDAAHMAGDTAVAPVNAVQA